MKRSLARALVVGAALVVAAVPARAAGMPAEGGGDGRSWVLDRQTRYHLVK